jgi:hypothetical protein
VFVPGEPFEPGVMQRSNLSKSYKESEVLWAWTLIFLQISESDFKPEAILLVVCDPSLNDLWAT